MVEVVRPKIEAYLELWRSGQSRGTTPVVPRSALTDYVDKEGCSTDLVRLPWLNNLKLSCFFGCVNSRRTGVLGCLPERPRNPVNGKRFGFEQLLVASCSILSQLELSLVEVEWLLEALKSRIEDFTVSAEIPEFVEVSRLLDGLQTLAGVERPLAVAPPNNRHSRRVKKGLSHFARLDKHLFDTAISMMLETGYPVIPDVHFFRFIRLRIKLFRLLASGSIRLDPDDRAIIRAWDLSSVYLNCSRERGSYYDERSKRAFTLLNPKRTKLYAA